jgi:hypothetical protein
MTWLLLSFALARGDAQQATSQSGWWATGRIVDGRDLHVGVRPAAFVDPEGAGGSIEYGVGITIQVSIVALP